MTVIDTSVPTGTRKPPRFRLRRRQHKVALVAHVLASVGWFGVAVVVAIAALGASATRDGALARALYRTLELFPWVSIPVGVIAAFTGAVLSLGTRFGFVRYWWVVDKIVITIAVITTDAFVLSRFAHDAASGASTPLWHGAVAHVVVLVVATVLSVFKPFGTTARGRRMRSSG